MIGLIQRAISLGVRVLLPLLLLALTDEHELGVYYLLTAFYGLLVSLGGLEASYYYSRSLVRAPGQLVRQAQLWSRFLQTIALFSLGAALIGALIGQAKFHYAIALVPFFIAFVASETMVNESTRLMWLVNRPAHATRSDLVRSFLLVTAVACSALTMKTVIAWPFFLIMAIGNAGILYWHTRQWPPLRRRMTSRRNPALLLVALVKGGRRCLSVSLPQFAYMQTVALWLLMERLSLDASMGKAAVAGYAFGTGIVVAGVSLILLPSLSNYKNIYLGIRRPGRNDRFALVVRCARVLTPLAFVLGIAVWLGVPVINHVMNRQVELPLALALAGAVSAACSGVCGQIGITLPAAYAWRLAIVAGLATLGIFSLPLLLGGIGVPAAAALVAGHGLLQVGLRVALIRFGKFDEA